MKTSVWEGVTALVLVFGLFGVFVVRAATFIRLNEAVTRPFEGPETFRISAFDYWFQFTKVVWLLGSLLMLLVGFLSGHWLRGLMGYAVWLAFMAVVTGLWWEVLCRLRAVRKRSVTLFPQEKRIALERPDGTVGYGLGEVERVVFVDFKPNHYSRLYYVPVYRFYLTDGSVFVFGETDLTASRLLHLLQAHAVPVQESLHPWPRLWYLRESP